MSMCVDVDVVNLNVDFDCGINFNGHHLVVLEGDRLLVRCINCDEMAAMEIQRCLGSGPRKWEAILYLLHGIKDYCPDDASLDEAMGGVMNKYIGAVASPGTVSSMKQDMKDVLGSGIEININV